MSYKNIIEESKRMVYERAIATKILDLMESLRKSQSTENSRRWIWELIQNAKDASYENDQISIKINIAAVDDDNEILEFSHNGQPFSVSNVSFLIEQVSNKDRTLTEDKRTTGKFGTGFLTTHLLSEKVDIRGVVKEKDEPYKQFNLMLDRSGKNLESISESVKKSQEQLNKIIDNKKLFDFNQNEYNTCFRYNLDKKGMEVARLGLKDFTMSIIYVLVFVKEIKKIEFEHKNICFKLDEEVIKVGEFIKIYTVLRIDNGEIKKRRLAVLQKNYTTIATEVNYKNGDIFFSKNIHMTPKLFCDFPLVGSEEFSFPIVVNNPFFTLNDPRTSIFLTDDENQNKVYVTEACELYLTLLREASKYNWKNMYEIARIRNIEDDECISKKCVKNLIINPLREEMMLIPIIDTNNGRKIPIQYGNEIHTRFPIGVSELISDELWELINKIIPDRIPIKEENSCWHRVIWNQKCKLTLKEVTEIVEANENIRRLEKIVREVNPINWLNHYYKIIAIDEEFKKEFISSCYKIIPNQNGKLCSYSELYLDNQIDDPLKDILHDLGFDIRDMLVKKDVIIDFIDLRKMSQQDVIEKINKSIRNDKSNSKILSSLKLISLYSNSNDYNEDQKDLYKLCKQLLNEKMTPRVEILNWSDEICEEANKVVLKEISKLISSNENITALTELLQYDNKNKTLEWINQWVSYLLKTENDNIIEQNKYTFLPNQNGVFVGKDDLCLDDDTIPDKLKDILEFLGYDYRKNLLDKSIFLTLPATRHRGIKDVATKIIELVPSVIANLNRSEKEKLAFRKLYLWFMDNKEKAESVFGDLYQTKHRLCDDEEIAMNMQKAEELNEMMGRYNINNLSDLENLLKEKKEAPKEYITENILLSLGVSSVEELKELMQDLELSKRFMHTSIPDKKAFQYVQAIKERAKKRVIEYLESLDIYDCSEMEELSSTIIGGIKKRDMSIHIVIRPADNGEVLIYDKAEKDVLDYESAELWVDNGMETPRYLTFGGVLKMTGINRIPLK